MTNQTVPAPSAPVLPAFYRNPVPVDAVRHARTGLRPISSLSFARETNAILLTGSEFAMAARTYPIVFSGGEHTMPFAIVGLRDQENLFIDAAGRWREDSYVPAYVRRYPFIFSETPEANRLLLCVDEGSEVLDNESQQPLFADGKPTEGLQNILKFCEAFQAQHRDTLEFSRWLDRTGMLEDKIARAELEDGQSFTLRGFRLLNTQKLRALQDAQVLDLHKRGWLPLLHFHLQSLNNFGSLNRLMRDRGRPAA
jgi:hypothetical protein